MQTFIRTPDIRSRLRRSGPGCGCQIDDTQYWRFAAVGKGWCAQFPRGISSFAQCTCGQQGNIWLLMGTGCRGYDRWKSSIPELRERGCYRTAGELGCMRR